MNRKTIAILIAALFACHTADAQSLSDFLRFLGLGSSSSSEQTVETERRPALMAEGLLGTWRYSEPAVQYDGNDMLGSIGVKAMEAMLPSMYAKAGLSAGDGTVTFTAPDVASGRLGGHQVTGRYDFTPADGTMTVSATVGSASGELHGTATLENGVLTLLFDASEAAAIVERVSSKAASNDSFKMMKSLLDSYPGVKLGCKLKR